MEELTPCNGVCRMQKEEDEIRCTSCFRTFSDIEQWFYMTNETRQERMNQLKREKHQYNRKK
jgi:predicted Fe-S protein YdhL (DUF1289 family)